MLSRPPGQRGKTIREWLRNTPEQVFYAIVAAMVLGAGAAIWQLGPFGNGSERSEPVGTLPLSPPPPEEAADAVFHPATCGPLARFEHIEEGDRVEPVVLDVNTFARIHPQRTRPRETDPSDPLRVKPHDVIQLGITVQNAERAETARVAQNLRLAVIAPRQAAATLAINAVATSDTAVRSTEGHKLADSVELQSEPGERVYLTNFRNPQTQENRASADDRYEWGRLEDLPVDCGIETRRSAATFVLTYPSPNADGSLGPGSQEAVRYLMLIDVAPLP